MPATRVSMRKTREILRLRWGLQRSLRDTAASCGLGATTVHDVVARARAAGLHWPLPDDFDDAALEARLDPPPKGRDGRPLPDFATIYRELKRRGVTLELLWQEYRQPHPDLGYGYSRVGDLYRAWRGQLDLVMRQEHRAGEKRFVDYAGRGIDIVDPETGAVTEAPVFVAALGASSFTYAEACEGEDLRAWGTAHLDTFEYHTPGHTPGSQCFLVGNALVSGDTLFIGSCGRVDLPGSNPSDMYRSLTQVLAALPDDTLLYPGHNYADRPRSTIGDEKRRNPMMRFTNLADFLSVMSPLRT